jgi:hypothetical protein
MMRQALLGGSAAALVLAIAAPALAQEIDTATWITNYERADAAGRSTTNKVVEDAYREIQAANASIRERRGSSAYCENDLVLEGPQLMTIIHDTLIESPAVFSTHHWRQTLFFALVRTFPCN